MTYESPQALRAALEQRLLNRSQASGISLDRLRRRVLFERVVARLDAAEPGRWVLKGGMALEVRLADDARLTKDLDLGLRDEVASAVSLQERMLDALEVDLDGDGFELSPGPPEVLSADVGGHVTWRVHVTAQLGGRLFGGIRVDVSPRVQELDATDRVELPNSLDFAGVPARTVEIVDVNRHAAEKFHAMTRDFGDRENSRVRDLVDLVLLIEHDMLSLERLRTAALDVWTERNGEPPPTDLPPFPLTWPDRYERIVAEHELDTKTFTRADALVRRLWSETITSEEN